MGLKYVLLSNSNNLGLLDRDVEQKLLSFKLMRLQKDIDISTNHITSTTWKKKKRLVAKFLVSSVTRFLTQLIPRNYIEFFSSHQISGFLTMFLSWDTVGCTVFIVGMG